MVGTSMSSVVCRGSKKWLAVLLVGLSLGLGSCTTKPGSKAVHVVNHSFARLDDVVTEHIDLDLEVDFRRQQIRGKASLRVSNKSATGKLFLDTRALRVQRVTLGEHEESTSFVLGDPVEHLGRPLIIDVSPETRMVSVYYETTEKATALGWLTPAQTADGTHPFLYTQGQAIQNRSWIPCQDNPGVRVTYHARIRTPPQMRAVMSAKTVASDDAMGVHEFDMPQPIPPYLIALAVGDLEFKEISGRCGVYAEPSLVAKAAWEFADAEAMMRQAEALYGPYRWERFDIIVLPPSFPYGGMENPRLTFVTPVLVAGDRSLVATIAHELAHSWSGNLVTNASWEEFWLNEGFTTYFERRILEALYGTDYMEMEAVLGFGELQESLENLREDDPDTRLHNDLSERDPDDGITWVPYEKGYLFLRMIEETVGRERWDEFLRGYFDTFAFQTMTSARFAAYLRRELVRGDRHLEGRLRIDEWVYGAGLPDNAPAIRSRAFQRVTAAVDAWKAGTPASELPTTGWSSQEWKRFIQQLPSPLDATRMRELDEAFDFTNGSNAEVLQVWLLRAVSNRYAAAYPRLESYLVGIGRIWLIGSLYRKLAETSEGFAMAKRIYAMARPGYHPMAVATVDRILAGEGG
jgi:leukotriene-A4 hydrolase